MARIWLSIRVELVEGRGERLWPRPGRFFAAARHTRLVANNPGIVPGGQARDVARAGLELLAGRVDDVEPA